MSRQEYNKTYYENNKEKLKEYNKNKQRALYSEEETREKKKDKNRQRYNARVSAYNQVMSEANENKMDKIVVV